jgi:hypothetical protein
MCDADPEIDKIAYCPLYRGQTPLLQVAKMICRCYLRGLAAAGDDQATSARGHGCDGRPRRVPGTETARSAAGWRPDPMARRPPPAGWRAQVPGCLCNSVTRCLRRSRPASAVAAMPPKIAVIGPKDSAASSNSIAEPMRMAAIPPNAVNVCLSRCMTGSLPVLLKIRLPRLPADYSVSSSRAFASQVDLTFHLAVTNTSMCT